jgi:AcrR family transcriptional regulator
VVQNQRERILAAVADVTSAASYGEMTVEDIIVTAGVSRRTFYEHFKNKDDAFLAAYDEAATRIMSAVRVAYSSHKLFVDRVRAGVEAFLTLLAADPSFARMCIVEVMAAGPEAVRRRNTAMGSFASMIEENARELLNRPPPSAITAETVVGGIYDVIFTRIRQGDVRRLPELVPDLVYSALLPYVGPADAEGARRRVATPAPARAVEGAA